MKLHIVWLSALVLTGCGTIPSAGPFSNVSGENTVEIAQTPTTTQAESAGPTVALLNASADVLGSLDLATTTEDRQWPAVGDPGKLKINIGDTLAITIYEQKAGGLFIPEEAGVRPGNFVSLPVQPVDSSGNILVPYVGSIHVAGQTPYAVSRTIVAALANRAINPQVVVSYADRGGAEVSVLGEVNAAQRHALSFQGERILDAIAKAGGPRFPAYETYVTLQRGDREYTLLLDDVVLNPAYNVYLQPGDTLVLYREPSAFTAFGAVTRGGGYDFGKRALTLSEALGKAFGLDVARANAGEVYVYREVAKDKLLAGSEPHGPRADELQGFPDTVPLILRFNLTRPGGYHLAQGFAMQNKDVVFVPDADTINLLKFISVILPSSGSAVNIKTLN